MDQTYVVCPVAPIHTTYSTHGQGTGSRGHQQLVLRKAGKGECVEQRPLLAAEAITLGQQALAALQQACAIEPPLVSIPAVQKTLQVWAARLVDFEAVRATPLPRPIAEFEESWRSEALLGYCAVTHQLRAAVTALVRMGWVPDDEEVEAEEDEEGVHRGDRQPFALEKLHLLPTEGRSVPGCPAVPLPPGLRPIFLPRQARDEQLP
jgi:hypothetical protein